jgi:hypothetical protein
MIRNLLVLKIRAHHQAPKATMKMQASEYFLTITNGDLRNEDQKTSAYALTSYGGQVNGSPAVAR